MADQFFVLDDPWTGPEIELFTDYVFFSSTDNWISEYHGKLYFDVTKNGGSALPLRIYFLDSEYTEIGDFQNFYMDNGVLTTCELQFPAEAHVIANILLRNMGEGSFTFTISDIRSDNVYVTDFWRGFVGTEELLE
jgi:hypothetical protein